MRFPIPLVAALALLSGCAARPPLESSAPESPIQAQERRNQAAPPAYNLAGYPPAVRDGYMDGCEAAKGSPHGRKDARRFAAEPQYSMGWNDGFAICGKR